VLIEDVPPSESDTILRSVNALLERQFGIAHTTVQFEHASCAISENGCAIPVAHEHEHTHPHDR
jgi:cobalt-zinc-cadmium efflux system protein